ncbi:hypothetical protein Q7C_1800 [Methylophaga frappieri]|uniref:Lipoprotein n=1 Tax=Methylophaga frappieri (strain ATCC BAA-2434 / DSM 25690 / JAM7) TaxID=754477 RepID=I1YJ48_METFJ|nr:hypothetical protein [Methylophaga frappieri]AFJ02941.1 hypothetical protein Q7C_1800 [Methylophaga frappieri]
MFKKTGIALLASLVILTGCGLKTSGVQPLGKDTYVVSSEAMNEPEAKGSALSQAQAHCAERSRQVLVTKQYKRHKVRYYYDVTFMCLPSGDERLVDPEYEAVPLSH